ncbi:MAG: prepilin-type N-terminal cleavage/methylation domain-containing protein [Planctomycetota bacterium]|nr:prepilin-type N-terminal cleavage/methylation domain-containing protein [Planctomycetota bacterium]MDI6787215.1 prepilin-type N-terminal cleavage/methylation domain-containing protein [Planctomycetota bacterium]
MKYKVWSIKGSGDRTGFTLIEVIVVLSIILVLASLVIPGLVKGRYLSRKAATRAEISEMERAIAMYNSDYGAYPSDSSDNSSSALLDALKGDPKADPPRRPYYKFLPKRIANNEYKSIFDKPFYYRENESEKTKTDEMKNPFTFDIWTHDGKDKADGINNWE